MTTDLASRIAQNLGVRSAQVAAALALLDDGATVPFIARYRKEATGSLDDLQVATVRDRAAALRALDERRAQVMASIEGQGRMTDTLREALLAAGTRAEVDDLYLPYRPKRRTRAQTARDRGLEPLADLIQAQPETLDTGRDELATPFALACPDLESAEAAWQGARDIVAERVSEDAELRAELRRFTHDTAVVESRVVPGKEAEGARFRDWFEHREPARSAPSHRVLAMRRGEAESVLTMRVRVERDQALALIRARVVRNPHGPLAADLHQAVEDAWDRLVGPAVETEARTSMKEAADAEAIRVFAANLSNLLLSPPLGGRKVVAVDPGFRTGCKVVALSPAGDLVETRTVYPHTGEGQARKAREELGDLLARHAPDAVAVGNGTASRETDAFVRAVLAGVPEATSARVVAVSEAGASVYSASEVAREELPDQDVTVRGAVSIGRRLQDPLAELIKIDPKSIGVGQYQHDVDQGALQRALDDVVAACVNGVGVELNTASRRLLEYVSGIGPALAKAIVDHRAEHGPFRSRAQLLDVPRLGPRTYELAAGFLRIRGGEEPLDASAVHPERYGLVARMAGDLGVGVADLVGAPERVDRIAWRDYVSADVGEPTLRDILQELRRPGRDPRRAFEAPRFRADVTEVAHLQEGMVLEGVVTNVAAFGAFVDVGVHQDGLVHVSELSHQFVRDPSQAVAVGDRVQVKVLQVDRERKRIALSIKALQPAPAREEAPRPPRPERPQPDPRGGDRPREERRSPEDRRPPVRGGPYRPSERRGPEHPQDRGPVRPPDRREPDRREPERPRGAGRPPDQRADERRDRPEPFNNAFADALKGLAVKKKG